MDWKEAKKAWARIRDRVQDRWSELTREELDEIAGSYDLLVRTIQEKYGISRQRAELELRDFRRTVV